MSTMIFLYVVLVSWHYGNLIQPVGLVQNKHIIILSKSNFCLP